MNREFIAGELLKVVRDLVSYDDIDRKKGFMGVFKKLESLRGKYPATSDEAIFLGMVRDMALHISRGNFNRVKALGAQVENELNADMDLL